MDDLKKARQEIDQIDKELADLFLRRMEKASEVAKYKKEHDLPILDSKREEEIFLNRLGSFPNENLKDYYAKFLKNNIELSKDYQRQLLNTNEPQIEDLKVIEIETLPSYKIYLKSGLIDQVEKCFDLDHKVLILTDDGVPSEYTSKVASKCKEAFIYVIPQGEKSKSLDNYSKILSFMLEHNFSRKDVLVAVGGGVVGDLGGFVASSYMRGITFYNIPTTLLSQVDSSIGGKTAVDFEGYKNVVGAFYQPSAVLVDVNLLQTLDKRQLHAGLVEAIKMAATFDKEGFELIKASTCLENDLEKIVINSLCIKKLVVEKDTKESGLRKVLNFGHTFGHAFESALAPNLLHGEAVGLGMLVVTNENVKNEIKEVLEKYNLPTVTNFEKNKILSIIGHDKKAYNAYVDLVLCNEIGTYEIKKVEISSLEDLL